MGYTSLVVITLEGSEEACQDALNAYKLTETRQQIEMAWHILEHDYSSEQVTFAYEVLGTGAVCCVWKFDWVKFYGESDRAIHRLGSIVNDLHIYGDNSKYQGLGLQLVRIGENHDDYEEQAWGCEIRLVDVYHKRDLEVDVSKSDVNPVVKLFSSSTGQNRLDRDCPQQQES
jgi:hypothetical protein